MGLPTPHPHPQPSALQSFLNTHPPPRDSPHPASVHYLALQVAHNLRFQHGWLNIEIHYMSSRSETGSERGKGEAPKSLPRPILSGLPPKRLYVHPDEQVEVLQMLKNERDSAGSGSGQGLGMRELDEVLKREREWVLPSHLREKWSLRRFGEVFDAVAAVPRVGEGVGVFEERGVLGGVETERGEAVSEGAEEVNEWRMKMPKRLLLATLDDDSTVVYYIVHDGIVKPRQN